MVLAAVFLTMVAGQASAWGNGANGPNRFGGHDWVLRAAVRAVGPAADWVCIRKALHATDDPDTHDGTDHASAPWWHVYDVWGADTYGGAPEAVRNWYLRVKRRLAEHDNCRASKALGIMSHMLADMAQPMHTDGYLAVEDNVHAAYEHAVDVRCTRSHCRYRMRFDGRDRARPYVRTVELAHLAHPYYDDLIKAFHRHRYNAEVDTITRRELNRAGNALTDLILSLGR